MDDVMRRISELARRARLEPLPAPPDPAAVLSRIRAAGPAGVAGEEEVPFAVFAGVGAFFAAAAAVVLVLAFNAWAELDNPLDELQTLMDVMT